MALIKCPECGNEVSDKSSHCIHCGYPLTLESNTISVRFPKDDDVVINMKYQITDSNGSILATGTSGQVVTFSIDEPTTLTCSLCGKLYNGYKFHPIEYVPHGNAQYEVLRRSKGFQSWVEMREETGDKVLQEIKEDKHEQAKSGTGGLGVFFAVLIAILVAVWLIPQIFQFELTFTAIPGK